MTDDYGTCVVAIPEDLGIPVEVEGGAHITLAYFGDESLGNTEAKSLIRLVQDLATRYQGTPISDIEEIDYFGEDEDALVLTLDSDDANPVVQLRNELLEVLTPSLRYHFESAETFPEYRPHITLGYISEGYGLSSDYEIPADVAITAIGVWHGDQHFDFPLRDIAHEGVIRRSGRYPWGSGDSPYQRSGDFLSTVKKLQDKGLTEAEIARGLGITTNQLRARKTIEKNAKKQAEIIEATKLKDKNWSNVAIGDHLGRNESYVRTLLDPAAKDKADILETTSSFLKDQVTDKGMIDVGYGVELHMGISKEKLATAVAMLKEEGYEIHNVQVDQLGTNQKTIVKVLAPPGTTYKDIVSDPSQIKSHLGYSEDGGRSFLGIEAPRVVSSKRLEVRYDEDGGSDMDGVIQLRRGVDDVSLGSANYAQVRISVDGTHYIKGMAMYTDDLPDGVDLRFNTNKSRKANKLDALKPIKDDPDNPFGSTIRQKHYINSKGEKELSALNIVNEEGNWASWSKNLSSQMLSKQRTLLAKEQLELSYNLKKEELDEIMSLTNPAVKKKLLESYADGADSSAVHLKAAGLPRTANHVILPFNGIKDTEIYAPNYRDGEKVVLIRHPHGGTFEIPELTVNNRNREARSVISQAVDAVGINSKVASRLSGADFDGDTVLVIPNNSKKVQTSPSLPGLKDYDPQRAYPGYDGMPKMSPTTKQRQMGDISNLITDMTILGAPHSEIEKAVKHSMVVIDAEKHSLNYKKSAQDNGISDLKKKYQGRSNAGASTLISRASSQERVLDRKLKSPTAGGVDPKTGKKVYTYSGKTYTNKAGKTVPLYAREKSTKLAETDDAFTLVSRDGGKTIEVVYATHSNKLKALGNQARKSALSVKPTPYSPSAKKAYSKEVASLDAKLNTALKNKPLERQAQLLANTTLSAKTRATPNMPQEELKKVKSQALDEARRRTGASKQAVKITPTEWDAIQSGAISNNKLTSILNNTDLDDVKKLATPRTNTVMSPAKTTRAKNMLNAGYTQAEIASALGIPTSTLNEAIIREGL